MGRVFNGDCPIICKRFLSKLKLYHVDDNNNAYVHAGWTFGHEHIEKSRTKMLGPEADFYWDRDFWYGATKRQLNPHNKVFIGHTHVDFRVSRHEYRAKPVKKSNIWNLDTGGGGEGVITCMCVDTEEYWQSDRTPELYDNFGFR